MTYSKEEIIKNWIEQSEINWKTAKILLKNKDYYSCLFFCHLTLEKLIKGLIIKNTDILPLYSHELHKLAVQSKITLSQEQKELLVEFTEFNINTRYFDQKNKYYKKWNKEFTFYKFKQCEIIVKWLRKEYLKKY